MGPEGLGEVRPTQALWIATMDTGGRHQGHLQETLLDTPLHILQTQVLGMPSHLHFPYPFTQVPNLLLRSKKEKN